MMGRVLPGILELSIIAITSTILLWLDLTSSDLFDLAKILHYYASCSNSNQFQAIEMIESP
jgi:hypothetical protein